MPREYEYLDPELSPETVPTWAKQISKHGVICNTCNCVFTNRYWFTMSSHEGMKVVGGIPTSGCISCAQEKEHKEQKARRKEAAATARARGVPVIHEFSDSGEAYDYSQCSDDIEMGDVLVVRDEGVVGFLLSAWPVAVTQNHGKFHRFTDPDNPLVGPTPTDSRDWTPQYLFAREVARQLNLL